MKTSKYATSLSCAAVLALASILTTACSKKPIVAPETETDQTEPAQANRNMYFGLWESKDDKGNTYTIRFTNSEWECSVEEGGISRPYYRGTYTYAGPRLNLLIKEEADLNTMGWRPERGNLGPSLTGALSGAGRVLNIRVLTETNFTKRR